MLQVDDIRQTRVFQEAKEEGIAQERDRSLRAVARLAALKMPAEQIAEILELEIELVRREMTGRNGDGGARSAST
jgi:predicted transposase YdaD